MYLIMGPSAWFRVHILALSTMLFAEPIFFVFISVTFCLISHTNQADINWCLFKTPCKFKGTLYSTSCFANKTVAGTEALYDLMQSTIDKSIEAWYRSANWITRKYREPITNFRFKQNINKNAHWAINS